MDGGAMQGYFNTIRLQKAHISKRYTQRIEWSSLNLRTRCKRLARKTICFSKSSDIHDKVIGTLIERIAL